MKKLIILTLLMSFSNLGYSAAGVGVSVINPFVGVTLLATGGSGYLVGSKIKEVAVKESSISLLLFGHYLTIPSAIVLSSDDYRSESVFRYIDDELAQKIGLSVDEQNFFNMNIDEINLFRQEAHQILGEGNQYEANQFIDQGFELFGAFGMQILYKVEQYYFDMIDRSHK